MKIGITAKHKNAYSETFIKAQIDLLPASIFLYGDWLPNRFDDENFIIDENKFFYKYFFKRKNKHEVLEKYLVKLLKKKKVDIILAQYGLGGVSILPVCKKLDIPLVVHFHGFDISNKKVIEENRQKYEELFNYCKYVIAVSTKMKNDLIAYKCPPEKIALIRYGPNEMFFKSEPLYNCDAFFSVGRFVDKKAPYLTILAFNELLKKHPSAELRMAGDGALLNSCKSLVKALKICKSVFFLGALDHQQVFNELQSALAFVQHSVTPETGETEGTPVAILEAQASAIPVISTRHAGIPDVVIENETGILVDEFDVIGMANAMEKLFTNRLLARSMGQAGRTRIKANFTMDKYINDLRAIISL